MRINNKILSSPTRMIDIERGARDDLSFPSDLDDRELDSFLCDYLRKEGLDRAFLGQTIPLALIGEKYVIKLGYSFREYIGAKILRLMGELTPEIHVYEPSEEAREVMTSCISRNIKEMEEKLLVDLDSQKKGKFRTNYLEQRRCGGT